MIVSAFLSMWISNSATTAMMLPIAKAVLEQLEATDAKADEQELQAAGENVNGLELQTIETKHEATDEKQPETQTQMENTVCEWICLQDILMFIKVPSPIPLTY